MKTLYLSGALLALLLAPVAALAQAGSVGIGTATPDASAVLDLSAGSKGLLIPRLDSAARVAIASPATGLLVFQTSPRPGFYYYGGSAWLFLPDKARGGDNLGSHAATQALNMQGNALTGTGASIGSTVGLGVRADGGLNIGQNTAGNNVLIGYQAGAALTTGSGNQFIGYRAGSATTTGFSNYFSGYQSGTRNTGGHGNLFSGYQSGASNTTGFGNVFSGVVSGAGNTTGSCNQFVGAQSGSRNTTGNNNLAFGYLAGPTTGNLTNAGAIGYRAEVSQSNSLVLGGTGANTVNVGIGTTAPNTSAVLDLSSDSRGLLIPRFDSVARIAIASPATGLLVFQTGPRPGFYYYSGSAWLFLPDKAQSGDNLGSHAATQPLNLQGQALVGSGANIGSAIGVGVRADGGLNIGQNTPGGNVLLGYLAGASITTGSSNMFVGYRAGNSNTTGINNLFSGYKSGYSNTTGRNNQFTGFYSGYSNTTGNFNYFSGYLSGDDNTTGDNNQFIGYNSGPLNTTGSNNVFIGYQSGYSNTTASNNQFVGYRSGVFNTTGENNHFNGNFAGYSNTTGENNYFSGYRAGNSNRTGNNNYFSGYDSGYYNTTGSNNQFSGYRSGNSNTTGNNNLFSGYNSGSINATGSNNWAFGYAAGPNTDGLTNAGALGYRAQVSQSNSLVLGGTGADAVRVGIGTKAPAAPLEVQAGTALTSSSIGTETELRLTRPGTGTKWDASADLALGTYATGINAQSQLNFRLGNDNTNTPDRTVLVLRGDGRVGIGTLTPTALLDVGGNAQVSGTLTAAAGVLTGLLTVSGTSNMGSLTVGGTSTLAGKVTAASVTTPDNSGANMLAAAYGNVFGAGTLANASGNVTVSRPGPAGEYLLTFSGPLATADFGSTALSLTLFNGPGFVSYTSGGSAGRLLVRTYNVGGTLTDRGFSFVVFQP